MAHVNAGQPVASHVRKVPADGIQRTGILFFMHKLRAQLNDYTTHNTECTSNIWLLIADETRQHINSQDDSLILHTFLCVRVFH